ncbi:MAG: hypothetical protein HGJ94_14055 [Desulfosarcina sp.]|nr:hypothetical protein [Desulfosarcina sp.]MBC2741545.1 hypothetical protein [Desulfosarcina sp.]MBC2764459.1 hypothetical protein [Desulfosarcina sp.]
MSGSIVDMAMHACWNCRATWLEDDQMYEDPKRCPHCGRYPDQRPGADLHGGGGSDPSETATWQGQDVTYHGETGTW